jgi:hypothetical protein
MAGTISYQPFIYQDNNNRVLTAIKASPMHDIDSAGDSNFSHPREQYVRAYSNLSVSNDVKQHKKWFGNHDSSAITERRRYNAIGTGSLNASGKPINFSGKSADMNVNRDALARVRGSGYVTTPKVRAKPAHVGSALTPGFPAGPLVRTQNRAPVHVLGDPTHGQYTTMRMVQPIQNFIPSLPDTGFFNRYRKGGQVSNFQTVLYH